MLRASCSQLLRAFGMTWLTTYSCFSMAVLPSLGLATAFQILEKTSLLLSE